MGFLKRRKRDKLPAHEDDLLGSVVNLFDASLVFVVGLMLAIVSAYHLHEIFSSDEFTFVKNPNKPGQMEIITKKGKEIKVQKLTKEKAEGQGVRLGIAYKLLDGRVVYLPEEETR